MDVRVEPITPFAEHIAKYFQNSIREDGLLALATHGVIYVEGGAGTLQEIFQDACQNYYHSFPQGSNGSGYFSPMIFFGDFWNDSSHWGSQVGPLLKTLFAKKPEAEQLVGIETAIDAVLNESKRSRHPGSIVHLHDYVISGSARFNR